MNSPEYRLIAEFYTDKAAARSGLPLMNHIHEGLAILVRLNANVDTRKAFCLHPLLQGDEDLLAHYSLDWTGVSSHAILLAAEYRNIANQYLGHMRIASATEIKLSPLHEVNLMLRADKIQNRKDFEKNHDGPAKDKNRLSNYFKNWFARLEITEEEYLRAIDLRIP